VPDKRWFEGVWVERPEINAISYFPPQWLEVGEMAREWSREDTVYSITIPRIELNQLMDFLTKKGYIKPTFSENRTEDVKMMHRMLDIIEKGLPARVRVVE
jgi:hypothetical protein